MPLINIGDPAPAFALLDQFGKHHALKDYAGRPVILYFYPKDDTSGCTAQACAFRDHHPEFTKIKGVILGVSPDDEDSHKRFVDKHALPFTLLADTPDDSGTPHACDAYGVWAKKSMYGRSYMGVVRTTYLIDGSGRIAARFDNVKVPGHAAEVLAALKDLHSGVKPSTMTEAKPAKKKKKAASKKTTRTSDSDPPYKTARSTAGKLRTRSAAVKSRGKSPARSKRK